MRILFIDDDRVSMPSAKCLKSKIFKPTSRCGEVTMNDRFTIIRPLF